VVSARDLVRAGGDNGGFIFRFGDDRGREEGVKGEASGGWRGGLEGRRGLTGGATAGVWSPRCIHTTAMA
jgi:hypothetical protein